MCIRDRYKVIFADLTLSFDNVIGVVGAAKDNFGLMIFGLLLSVILIGTLATYFAEYIQKNKAYGELGHPQGPTINLERVSHMIKSLVPEGSNFIGKAKVLDTPYGNIVKSLIDEGAQLGVSSRGMGTIRERNGAQEVQSDFMLSTAADIVADPSAPDAFVNGVMEGMEWVYDAASNSFRSMQVVDEIKSVGTKSAKDLNEQKFKLFNKFLRSL